jgi:hypothetical protein
MRDTVITMEQQLGTYPRSQELRQLFLGNTQSMQYKPSDRGPYYLSEEERIRQRHDRPTGKVLTKNKTKEMLLDNLKGRGINVSGTVAQLKDTAQQHTFGF